MKGIETIKEWVGALTELALIWARTVSSVCSPSGSSSGCSRNGKWPEPKCGCLSSFADATRVGRECCSLFVSA